MRRGGSGPTPRRRRDEAGAAALVVSITVPVVFLAVAALAIDVSRWYLERQRLQLAADAAALAGVPYMPHDLAAATTRAREVAARNGFTHGADAEVSVSEGEKPAQLEVSVTSTVDNLFGAMIGIDDIDLNASAVADYQGPAPMGSPCNTFGNEPSAGGGSSSARPTGTARGSSPFANCSARPQLWATVEGPQTGKVQGDRYQPRFCEAGGVHGCDAQGVNEEYDPFGYVFLVKVEPAAVNQVVDVQLFDPMFLNTGQTCLLLPSASEFGSTGNANPYVTNADARNRYTRDGSASSDFCTGDSFPGSIGSGELTRMVTSFVMREQVDSQEPTRAPVLRDTGGSECIKQYNGLSPTRSGGGFNRVPAGTFKQGQGGYISELAQTFHNWVSFCRFVPTRSGDYYLQVRSNVSLGGQGTGHIRSGNAAAAALEGNTAAGAGTNSFAIRAVVPAGYERSVAVSGYEHMPIYVNAPSATSTFNLLRVLPGAAGRRISFEFFDAADVTGASGGTVQVVMPSDATYTGQPFPGGCRSVGGTAGAAGRSLTNCTVAISNAANNGQVQSMTIPVPSDYRCDTTSLGGCWYQVVVSFPGAEVTDVTTWDARIEGDPVRLVE